MNGMTAFVVAANPARGRTDELRDWYHEVHLEDARLIPGVLSATLFEWQPIEGRPPSVHAFMAVYEVDGDPAAVWAEFDRRIAEGVMTMTDALDPSSLSFAVWTPSTVERGRGPGDDARA
jgi:hypothetical protein